MNTARTIAILIAALLVGLVGYQIGIAQNIATLPAGTAPVAPYAYGYYPWHFGFGFFGLLFPLLFFFLIFGLVRAAFWGGRGRWGYGSGHHGYGRLEEIHRELHGEKPTTGQPTSSSDQRT